VLKENSMKRLLAVVLALVTAEALADPCGMVPPIYTGPGVPITRVGPQRTYVFYKDGMETYVIRPGFQGKVDEFGMLIPFPSPPAMRKVSDAIFPHLASAIEPPEVVIDLRPRPKYEDYAEMSLAPSAMGAKSEEKLAYDEVKVLKREAVGMYEVATLAAGSAKALNRWMDEHGFKYPAGMDEVCNDYIKLGWVFVAEKTRVGSKPNSDPKPGMKSVNPAIPSGANFDGYVQAMGFRYKVDKPSVPMRLSPFNEGEKRQIVYYLTDQPVRFDGVDTTLVKRQVPGWRLYKNIMNLLPVRVVGGSPGQVSKDMLANLRGQRNPKPHNGEAKALFASDLRALKTGQLSLDHEEKEKELLRIGEALNLRGPEIDLLHEAHLDVDRDKSALGELGKLESLYMTVIDGDFPIQLMKDKDLTTSKFGMPPKTNTRVAYDCKNDGPGSQLEGIRWEAP
jgi:hypothetical protein